MDNKQSYGITNQASDLSDENLSPMKSSAIIRARDRRFSRRNKSSTFSRIKIYLYI